jgi:DNA-directed RNA polymerase subunit RPC12/RpoP
MKITNLERYGTEYASQSESVKEKMKITNLERYGTESFTQTDEYLERAQKTNLERYGTKNPAQALVIKNRISKNLRKSLYDRLYITYSDFIVPVFSKQEYIDGIDNKYKCVRCGHIIHKRIINGKVPKCNKCTPKNISENKWLDSFNNPNMKKQYRIFFNNDSWVYADGYDPTTNTVYEYWGDYWHGNPAFYDRNDRNKSNGISYGELYDNTIMKINNYKSHGYNVIDIWHSDFSKVEY